MKLNTLSMCIKVHTFYFCVRNRKKKFSLWELTTMTNCFSNH